MKIFKCSPSDTHVPWGATAHSLYVPLTISTSLYKILFEIHLICDVKSLLGLVNVNVEEIIDAAVDCFCTVPSWLIILHSTISNWWSEVHVRVNISLTLKSLIIDWFKTFPPSLIITGSKMKWISLHTIQFYMYIAVKIMLKINISMS